MRESAEKVLHFNFSPIQGAKTSMTSVHHFSCRANFSRRTSAGDPAIGCKLHLLKHGSRRTAGRGGIARDFGATLNEKFLN